MRTIYSGGKLNPRYSERYTTDGAKLLRQRPLTLHRRPSGRAARRNLMTPSELAELLEDIKQDRIQREQAAPEPPCA